MNKQHELVLAAVHRMNLMTEEAYFGAQGVQEVQPVNAYRQSLFTAEISESWEAINFLGGTVVWCPESDQHDTPEDGETVESIVAYIWEHELKELTALMVALGKQFEGVAQCPGCKKPVEVLSPDEHKFVLCCPTEPECEAHIAVSGPDRNWVMTEWNKLCAEYSKTSAA